MIKAIRTSYFLILYYICQILLLLFKAKIMINMKAILENFTHKKFFILVAALAFTSNSFAQKTGKGITFTPMLHAFKLDKGNKAVSTLNIINNINRDYALEVQIIDWERNEQGSVRFLPGNTSTTSCANWVTVDKNLIELKANSQATVNITMNVPDTASTDEMKWCMLLVTTLTEKTAPKKYGQIQSQLTQRFGAQVIVSNSPPSVTHKEVNMLGFETIEKDSATKALVKCKNGGKLMLRCTARIELLSNTTGEKTNIESEEFTMFPEEERHIYMNIPATLPKGTYTAVAFVDANDDDVPLEASQATIEIK